MIEMEMPIAYMSESKSAVMFTEDKTAAGTFNTAKSTAVPVKDVQNALKVAPWGEDNRFPQNIEQAMAFYGVGKAGLKWKAHALWGNGIIPGKITDYEDEGKKEIFKPLERSKYKTIYNTLEQRSMFRFFLEYFMDWSWYENCFPEIILSKDGKTITALVQQESCDCRFQQMNDKGEIEKVFLSKLWGMAKDQYAKFDPEKRVKGIIENPKEISEVDNKFVKEIHCIDPYNAVNSLKNIAEKQKNRAAGKQKSAILPVQYPSVNKTYYQVPAWDGARLGGWLEIASKIPAMLKKLFNNAFRIKYQIHVPENYFHKIYGKEAWMGMKSDERMTKRREFLKKIDEYLSGAENAYKTFLSVYDVDPHTGKEMGLVKIEVIEDKTNIDKELLTQSAADIQMLVAMGINPTLFGAGTIGTGQQRSGGSDLREAYLIYCAGLHLERNILLEPLYLIRDYNRIVGGVDIWEDDIVFRFRDTVLTTLDQGKGTEKKVS
jgi:hypothetical protein